MPGPAQCQHGRTSATAARAQTYSASHQPGREGAPRREQRGDAAAGRGEAAATPPIETKSESGRGGLGGRGGWGGKKRRRGVERTGKTTPPQATPPPLNRKDHPSNLRQGF